MFVLASDTPAATAASARLLVVTPSAVTPIDGAPIEDVLLLRACLQHAFDSLGNHEVVSTLKAWHHASMA
jgi:hypothetical protein